MAWPRDDASLELVRALMAEQDLDALVVRAPDNVLYLSNFWGMKGYDAVVFPREGEPVLICLEASAEDASRASYISDIRLIYGYAPDDPRPVPARTLDAALAATRDYGTGPAPRPAAGAAGTGEEGRLGRPLSPGPPAPARVGGEPTTFTKAWFDA